MKLVLIAALAPDGTIGDAGTIPWHISDDLRRFKKRTLGHPVIMGRKTWQSLGRPLPGRTNIILTRDATLPLPAEVVRFADLATALDYCRDRGDPTAFIIGGAEVYRLALPLADELVLTHVRQPVTGDTKFPAFDRAEWKEVSREETAECAFVDYVRQV